MLFVKEWTIRRKQAGIDLMWMTFAVLTLAVPVGGQIFFFFRLFGSTDGALATRYFCYPFARMSTALGLLLRPSSSFEKAIAKASGRARIILLFVAVATLIVLNFNSAKKLRIKAASQAKLNLQFYHLVTRYNASMTSFLNSPTYSANKSYYFKDMLAANFYEYPSSWLVMLHNLFQLYFPHVKNIHFVTESKLNKKNYLWLPEGIKLE